MTLRERLPSSPTPESLLDAFLEWTAEHGLTLYPAQEEALLEVVAGNNLILSTPTGSGKSLVATGAHFAALASGERSYYTAPIKALVSEKFFALVEIFGPESVGMITGDSSVNAEAPIICCTAEILANLALREGATAQLRHVVMDEFHFYAEPDRGWAWQVPLLELPQAQFVLMSATLGDVSRFETDLTERTGRPTSVVSSAERPVPLSFRYAMTPLHETLEELVSEKQAPIYVVHFSQAAATEQAQALLSMKLVSKQTREAIVDKIHGFRFAAGFGRVLSRLVKAGIGVHHAGMLPKYRRLVEQLAQAGLLTVICGTDTLGVGINVPMRTVLLSGLSKFDGTRNRHLKAREFHQIAGRAGRAGYDTEGAVVVQAPEHEIENAKALAKAGDDPKKRRKVVRKKPPEGVVSWSDKTFDKLVTAEPEALTSRFRVSHAMLLNVISRGGDVFASMRELLTTNHDARHVQRQNILRAIGMYRALVAAGIVRRVDSEQKGLRLEVTEDVQVNFALNQPLSLFAVAAMEVLDPNTETYALDVISVIESTVEDPRPVLNAQRSHARGEAVAAMKAEGIEYEQRMELLEDVTYPQPLADLLEVTYETYRQSHPWVADEEPSPKSIVRDMMERGMNFVEFIKVYSLARSEGLVLRYLTDVYKALRQTVPEEVKTEELVDITEWLGDLVRNVDSSLLDEWERLMDPSATQDIPAESTADAPPLRITANTRAFRVRIRNAMFRRVELAARQAFGELGELDGEQGWDAQQWESALADYFAEYSGIGTGPEARGPALLSVTEESQRWLVRQVFDDPEGDRDWAITAEVDLPASDAANSEVLRILTVGPM